MRNGVCVAEKGVFELLEAVTDSDGRGALPLTFAGEGPAAGELKRLAAERGERARVTFAGHRDSDELAACYRAADVLVLPSYSEGFPTVVAEAMGFGLPVVCTRLRGAVDYLRDRENALFVDARDAADLRAKLLELRDDFDLRVAMGAANVELVKVFSPRVVVDEYASAILEARDTLHA